MTHAGIIFEYSAPTIPRKPNVQPGWREVPTEEKREQWKLYRKQLQEYKNKLRPDKIRPPISLPESIRPCFIAVGNPCPNVLAFSLYDIREDILESLSEHPEVKPEDGVLKVDILGSDGCDVAAGYHMMSKLTEREIPDRVLAFTLGLLKSLPK